MGLTRERRRRRRCGELKSSEGSDLRRDGGALLKGKLTPFSPHGIRGGCGELTYLQARRGRWGKSKSPYKARKTGDFPTPPMASGRKGGEKGES